MSGDSGALVEGSRTRGIGLWFGRVSLLLTKDPPSRWWLNWFFIPDDSRKPFSCTEDDHNLVWTVESGIRNRNRRAMMLAAPCRPAQISRHALINHCVVDFVWIKHAPPAAREGRPCALRRDQVCTPTPSARGIASLDFLVNLAQRLNEGAVPHRV
jgi:hypothetical protein